MYYYKDIQVFESKKEAEKYLQSMLNDSSRIPRKKMSIYDVIFQRMFAKNDYWRGYQLNVDYMNSYVVGYQEKSKDIKFLNIFDIFNIEEDYDPYNLEDIINNNDSDDTNNKVMVASVCYSIMLILAFLKDDYNSAIRIMKNALEFAAKFNRGHNLSLRYSNAFSGHANTDKTEELKPSNNIIRTLCYLKFRIDQKSLENSDIIEYLNMISHRNTLSKDEDTFINIEDITNDPFILKIHNQIISMNPKAVSMYIKNNMVYDTVYSLDTFESSPEILELFLDSVKKVRYFNKDNVHFKYISVECKDSRERLVEILRSYFYSKYGKGHTYYRLEDRLNSVTHFLTLMKYTDVNITDVVADLPDKIVGAALKGVIGS